MMDVRHARQHMGSAFGVRHRDWSIRNSCSKINISQTRDIGCSSPPPPPVSAFRIPSDRPSLKSVSGSAGLHVSRSPVSPNPIPSSPGTGGSLPASSTAPSSVLPAGPTSSRTRISIVRFAEELRLGIRPRRRSPGRSRPRRFRSTVGNILADRNPAHQRNQTTTWKDFVAAHMAVLAGTDFFTVEVLTWRDRHLLRLVLHSSGIGRVSSRRLTKHPTPSDNSDGSQRHRRRFRIPPWHALPSS